MYPNIKAKAHPIIIKKVFDFRYLLKMSLTLHIYVQKTILFKKFYGDEYTVSFFNNTLFNFFQYYLFIFYNQSE